MIPGNVSELASKPVTPPQSEAVKPSGIGARLKHFLGLDQPARSKGSTHVAPVTSKPLFKRALEVGPPPPPRATTIDPADPHLAWKPMERVALFLAKQMQQDTWDQPAQWEAAFKQELIDLYHQPAALSEAEREALKHPDVLIKYLASRALDATPPGKEGTVSNRLGQLMTSGALKQSHAQAMIQLGDLKTQLLAQHSTLEPLTIRDVGVDEGVSGAKQAQKSGKPSSLTPSETKATESRQPDDLTIDDLPPSIRQSEAFQAFLGDLAKKVMTTNHLYALLPTAEIGKALNAALSLKDPKGNPELRMPMAFSLSDGKAFMNSLVQAAKAYVPIHEQTDYQEKADRLNRNNQLQEIFSNAKYDLVDKIDEQGVLWLGKTPYLLTETLGSGASGDVSRYQKAIPNPKDSKSLIPDPSDPGLAVKFARGDDTITEPTQETKVLVNAVGTGNNDNIAPPRSTFLSEKHGRVIVLPMAKHGSLKSVFDISFKSATNRSFVPKTTLAAAFLTPFVGLARALIGLDLAKGIAHRDIALRNVLVTDGGKGKLADFGLSTTLVGNAPTNATKSVEGYNAALRWSPPEQYKTGAVMTSKSNTWMFGMALYEAVYGKAPLERDGDKRLDELERNNAIRDRVLAFDPATDLPAVDTQRWPSPLDQKLHALLAAILKPEPKDRPSMVEVEQSLRDIMKDVGVGINEGGQLLDFLLSTTPPALTPFAQDLAKTALQPPETWGDGIVSALVTAYKSDAVKHSTKPNVVSILSSPETALQSILMGALEFVPPDQEAAVLKILQSREFKEAFEVAHHKTTPLRPLETTPPSTKPGATTPGIAKSNNSAPHDKDFYMDDATNSSSDVTPVAHVSFETTEDEQVAPTEAPNEENNVTPSDDGVAQNVAPPTPSPSTETNPYDSLSSLRDKADGYGVPIPITELKPGLSKEESPYATARTEEARALGYGKAKPITELGKTLGETDPK
jgi:serine/threonine protein kinase